MADAAKVRVMRETLLRLAGCQLAWFHISAVLDSEPPPDDGPGRAGFTIQAVAHDGKALRAWGESPADALAELLGRAESKQCYGPCALIKPLREFSSNRAQRDGKALRCRTCERLRKAMYDRRKGVIADDEPAEAETSQAG